MKNKRTRCTLITIVGLSAVALNLGGCERGQATGPPQKPVPEVAVVTVSSEPVTLTTELPGRVASFLEADVRPQVSGIIQSRLFEEGQGVEAGMVLYQIAPARYQATYDRAKAALAVAEAELPAIQSRLERYRSALAENAVSQQDYDDTAAAVQQAEATIALRRAEVESAHIDLSYTRITAPISGRIGKSKVTVGSLVTTDQPAALATIHQFDPAYVDVPQSSKQFLELRRDLETGRLKAEGGRAVRVVLEEGTAYPLEGTLQFRDVQVDPTTGSFVLRITVPNPDHVLLPGMFVRAVVQEGVVQEAILVPQEGVSRNPKGEAIALVVDDGGKVEQRTLVLNRALGRRWLVDSGLAVGDRLIVEGLQNVRPGADVKVVSAESRTPGAQGDRTQEVVATSNQGTP
ncbi:MAG: efflux RND transporter periplasmic adaptor subunit [Phycisphaerae bacterium]|nr:efflux RND transporter periplasmic adaptor subunit [Phycisphaerae bacterium]